MRNYLSADFARRVKNILIARPTPAIRVLPGRAFLCVTRHHEVRLEMETSVSMLNVSCSTVANKNPFEQAIEQFHASLAPKERSLFSKCNSADELLSTVEDLEIIKKSRESSRLVRRVKLFNDSLGHYFAVIDILVQSHPEYAALAWGAVRLVLQVFRDSHRKGLFASNILFSWRATSTNSSKSLRER